MISAFLRFNWRRILNFSKGHIWPSLYQKSDLCIPRNETAQPRSQFLHSCICEQFILYIPRIGLSIWIWLQQNRQTGPGNIIVHRYMNDDIVRQNIIILFWKRGSAFSFLGIHKSEPEIYIGISTALHSQCWRRWGEAGYVRYICHGRKVIQCPKLILYLQASS